VTAVLPLKQASRELIVELSGALSPYFADITARWREQLREETGLEPRSKATLERITLAGGADYFKHGDFDGFFENLNYSSTRLAKLQVDTRIVSRALEIFQTLCEPYVASLFCGREAKALAALEMLASSTFVAVTGGYFDARTREASALVAILDVELAETDLDAMLQSVLEITCNTFEAVMGTVLLCDEDTDLLRVRATVGLPTEVRGEFSIEVGQGFAGSIARKGEPEILIDAPHDPRIVNTPMAAAKSLWGVPLKSEGKTIGVVLIGFPKPYEWMPTERELIRAIADRSSLAIHRARMTSALRERETRIAELSSHLLQVQEEERKRLSRELHDETGQALMVIRLYLGMLESTLRTSASKSKVKETLETVDKAIVGIRRIIGRLSPLVLEELGLFSAVRKEVKDLEKNSGVRARAVISEAVGRLSTETETAIYRIVQEALHNIAKHAQATSATVTMSRENGSVRLQVEDNGVGIFPKSNFRGNSFGLAGIKERVGMLGGDVRVISMKGKGTRIEVTVPATSPSASRVFPNDIAQQIYAAAANAGGESSLHAENKMSSH
jgi:signal transduction histidine kinase